MTNAQSKFFQSVAITCKDYQHPWTDKCVNASSGLLLAAFPYCLRVYSLVYMLSLVMRHRIPTMEDLKRTVHGILQSTAFLTTNAYGFIMFNCLIRNLLGRYYYSTVGFWPCFFGSYMAITVERPARRPLLTLYVANVATETLWNMAKSRGWVRSIPHGQAIIFGLSISALLYLYRLGLHKTTCKDSIYNILRLFVGKSEEGLGKAPAMPGDEVNHAANSNSSSNNNNNSEHSHTTGHNRSRPPIDIRTVNGLVQLYSRFVDAVRRGKHASCRHKQGCIPYAIAGGVLPFVGGISLQVALKFVMNLRKIVSGKLDWRKTIWNRQILNLGIFLGSFSFLYKSVSCTLRHSFGRDDPIFAIPAGLIGSVAFTKYPDITVALYVMWKALQILYNLGIEKGVVPEVKYFTEFFYAFCTAILFHTGILEPRNLRPSYFKFLQDISGERLSKFRLEAFDVFGYNTSENAKLVMQQLKIFDRSDLPKFAMV